jgi:uncharacterized protein (DUF1015 family)
MAIIREFRGLRPRREIAARVAELPYDVISSDEARKIAGKNPTSFFHVTKPEVDLPPDVDLYDDRVYDKGRENLQRFIKEGTLKRDSDANLYLYSLVMNGRTQTGLVACVSIDDYLNDKVKKHELTRKDKELDRTKHIDRLNAQTGLVFLLYREDGTRRELYKKAMALEPAYDFTSDDGIRHILRVVEDRTLISALKDSFRDTVLYIADGHHRAASSASVGIKRREAAGGAPSAEAGYFLATIFPHDELKILAYNRVLKDLNGLDRDGFLKALGEKYAIVEKPDDVPAVKHTVCMYMAGTWYTLTPKFPIPKDVIQSLDVRLLQDTVLDPILGIQDPRTSKRIDFIGGIRGAGELKRLVDSGEFAVAFSMHPTSVDDLVGVSDSGGIMPPKSTWFEPKLRSGLIIHEI